MERESRTLEYKEIVTNTFLKTVSAFSNYGTGRESQNTDFESLPAHTQELAFNKLREKLTDVLHIEKLSDDIMKTLDLYSNKDGYNRAAELLADKNGFPGMNIVRFGTSVNELMDSKTLEYVSVLELYDAAVEMYKTYYQYEKIDGMERKLEELVPENAFREAIANSIVHRVWDINGAISVFMFPDKIEITSPGGLPADISEDEYLHSQISVLRNPKLGNVFYRLRYIERFGTGITRIRKSYEKSYRKPEFYVFENSIKIILPVVQSEADTPDEQKVISALRDGKLLTRTEIETLAGFDKTKILRVINMLLAKNMIEKSGQGRSTRYRLKE